MSECDSVCVERERERVVECESVCYMTQQNSFHYIAKQGPLQASNKPLSADVKSLVVDVVVVVVVVAVVVVVVVVVRAGNPYLGTFKK